MDKDVTNEELARMIARGFEETAKKVDVDKQFAEVNTKLEHIETILLTKQNERIQRLEEKVKKLEDALAM